MPDSSLCFRTQRLEFYNSCCVGGRLISVRFQLQEDPLPGQGRGVLAAGNMLLCSGTPSSPPFLQGSMNTLDLPALEGALREPTRRQGWVGWLLMAAANRTRVVGQLPHDPSAPSCLSSPAVPLTNLGYGILDGIFSPLCIYFKGQKWERTV